MSNPDGACIERISKWRKVVEQLRQFAASGTFGSHRVGVRCQPRAAVRAAVGEVTTRRDEAGDDLRAADIDAVDK